MSTLTPPALRIVGARFRLLRRRGQNETADAFVLDALLLELAALVKPKAGPVPQASIAAAVERSAQIGIDMAWDAIATRLHRTCTCGHDWTEHLSRRGCTICVCTTERPRATQPAPAGAQ